MQSLKVSNRVHNALVSAFQFPLIGLTNDCEIWLVDHVSLAVASQPVFGG